MTIIDPVQQIVLNCLNHFAYQDAIFLSERLHAEIRSEESLYLLALSHYRSGTRCLRAYHLLKERHLKLPKSKYLLAKCCLDLNKYSEAESVLISDFIITLTSSHSSTQQQSAKNNDLNPTTAAYQLNFNSTLSTSNQASTLTNAPSVAPTQSTSSKQKLYDEILKEYGNEYACYVLQILATVYSNTDRISQSVEFYKKSLRLNPFIWSSFESICNLGEKIDPNKYFTFNSSLNAYKNQILDTNVLNILANQQQNQEAVLKNEKPQSPKEQTKDTQTSHHQKQQQNIQNQILKQIDPQNDFLDQKNRQEIANMLRLVESDQQTLNLTKLSNKQKNNIHQHVHHSNCVHHMKQNEFSAKENQTNLSSSKSDESQSTTTNSTQQTTISMSTQSTTDTSSTCCCCCNINNQSTDSNTFRVAMQNSIKQTSGSNPTTSSISLSTQSPLNTNTTSLAVPQKKRQASFKQTSKPLFGQNTTNTNMLSTSSNIRRSSRIFAAQSASNAVKENTKTTSLNTSGNMGDFDESNQLNLQSLPSSSHSSQSSSSSASSSSSSCSSSSKIKVNKRLKLKKKSDPNDLSSEDIIENDESLSPGAYVNNQLDQEEKISSATINEGNEMATDAMDCNSCGVYLDCKHCNLLSNQSKNNYLSQYSSQSSQSQSQKQQTQQQTSSNIRKKAYKFQILIEQSICLDNLMNLLRDIGMAFYNLKQFECEKALGYFELLPQSQIQSSFMLSNMARAHFELHNYLKAEKMYTQLRREYPYHLEGLEYYSTTLWHLQKEIALSALAQELTEYDKLAPETWCVVGNCFSLHKEHDAAIKFFQRATQVNPKFVYAYNLLGHEYFLIEEMDKGLSCFRKAIFLDSRHYNAWYGISMIHLKQEKFLLAEKYLKKALLINPHSSTLMCHIAVVYHSLKQSEKALQILDRALLVEAKNTLCKFHRASILFSMERYEDALEEFEKLRRIAPKESLIYYMISKTHKKLKNVHLSLMYMSWAMDLDPKGVNNGLKESIDKRYVVDSDSTFARELETINTSTLDAIYGGNELIDQNENDDELEELPDTSNNNIMEGLLVNQEQHDREQHLQQLPDDSDMATNQQDESSLIGEDSEMSRNNIELVSNASTGVVTITIEKNAQMKSTIASSLLEASNLLIDQLTNDQMMEGTNNDQSGPIAAGTSRTLQYEDSEPTGEKDKDIVRMQVKDILGDYGEWIDESEKQNNTYDVDEDEEKEEEEDEDEDDEDDDDENDDDEWDDEDDDDDEDNNGGGALGNSGVDDPSNEDNSRGSARKKKGSRHDSNTQGPRKSNAHKSAPDQDSDLHDSDKSEDLISISNFEKRIAKISADREAEYEIKKSREAVQKFIRSRYRSHVKTSTAATSTKIQHKNDEKLQKLIHGHKMSPGKLSKSSKQLPFSGGASSGISGSSATVIDSPRKKKIASKLSNEKKSSLWAKGSVSVPISLTKEMNPKVVIKKIETLGVDNKDMTTSSSYFDDSVEKKNSFLYKKIQAEKTESEEESDDNTKDQCTSIAISGSILINNKNNDSTDSKFTPELSGQSQMPIASCLAAPCKRSKFLTKISQSKKTLYKKQFSETPLDHKTIAVESIRQIQFNLTNPELSSTSSSMIIGDESFIASDDKHYLKGNNLNKKPTNKMPRPEITKSSQYLMSLDLFPVDKDVNSTTPDYDYADDYPSKSELFTSMNSLVDTSKTNETISFLHQSNIDADKSTCFESLKKQDTRTVNLSKDELMDSIEFT